MSPAPEERRDSRVGLVLGERYRVDALIDRGAMGRVYVGEHVLMHKRVAIKVLHRELTAVPEFVARFEREARAAANIGSEHVVAATDFGKLPDGSVFLVLEFIEGKNLRDLIAEGPVPVTRALHICRQIAEALAAAHALGIIHRDLKPENVMLVEKGDDPDFAKVLDFGIAKVPIGEPQVDDLPSSTPITKAGMVFGTPEYMPPEQALGQEVDERADLYSLGVITYELLSGRRPFVAESQVAVLGKQLSKAAPPFSERAPGTFVPVQVERFVLRLLEREAKERIQTARQVIDEIDRHLGYGTARGRIPTLLQGSRPRGPASGSLDDDELPTRRTDAPLPLPKGPLERVSGWVDARRSLLPAPLRDLPAPVLVSAPLGALGLLVGFGVVAAFSTNHHEPAARRVTPSASAVTVSRAAAPSVSAVAGAGVGRAIPAAAISTATATASELTRANAAGETALSALEQKYPNDASVRRALGALLLKKKKPIRAAQTLAEALALDPNLQNDAQIASALWMLAQNKKSSARAFEILEGPMGARGQTILHDLATTKGVRASVRKEAARALGGTSQP